MPATVKSRRVAPVPWQPTPSLDRQVGRLLGRYREVVSEVLGDLARTHFPALPDRHPEEYRKMVELSTKMMLAGNACCATAGLPFGRPQQELGALYGGCCFLADSFIDDYGEAVATEYLDRFETLLTKGWFEVRNDRERLFYVIAARLFSRRDLLSPMLRQAIFSLYLAQRRDVVLRMDAPAFRALSRRRQLALLRRCARDRGGHTSLLLTHLVAPKLALGYQHQIFLAGALFMYIDDHGDCHADRRDRRLTYMNQIQRPERVLRQLVETTLAQLRNRLPGSSGSDLLCAFLHRYFVTRLEKHRRERDRGALSWAVYE